MPVLAAMVVAGLPIVAGIAELQLAGVAHATTYRDAVLADDPLGYWRLDQLPPATAVADSATHDPNVPGDTAINGVIYPGYTSQSGALLGDQNPATGFGGSQYVDLGDTARLELQNFTVEAWFKVAPGIAGNKNIFRSGSYGMGLALVDGRPQGWAWQSTSAATVLSSPMAFDDNQWHHAVFTKDGTAVRLFVDGGVVGTTSAPAAVTYATANKYRLIGWDPQAAGSSHPVGHLDEIAVYDHAIDQSKVQSHYTTAGYELKPLGGPITADENPCVCNPGAPHVSEAQAHRVDPVNTAWGNAWLNFDAMTVPGRGLPLQMGHSYSSHNASRNGPLGYGWTHPFAMSLVEEQSGNIVKIRQEDSAQLTFTKVAGAYTAPLG